MDELLDEKQEMKNKRGKTLPVLSILSWIGLGLVMLTLLNGLIVGQKTAEELELAKYEMLDKINTTQSGSADEMEMMAEEVIFLMDTLNGEYWTIWSLRLLAAILGFLGVLMMYKLKRIGFYLYLGYGIIPVIGMLWLFGGSSIMMSILVFYCIFTVLFAILYGVQLKRME